MKKYIIIQGNVLEYQLQRKEVKNINLRIHEDKSIFVSANKSVPASKVEKFLISRQEFILSTLQRFDEMSQIRDRGRNLNDGDTYPILGEDKNLIVVQGLRQAFIKDNLLIISVEEVNCFEEKEMAETVSIESMLAGGATESDYQGYIDTVIEEVENKIIQIIKEKRK